MPMEANRGTVHACRRAQPDGAAASPVYAGAAISLRVCSGPYSTCLIEQAGLFFARTPQGPAVGAGCTGATGCRAVSLCRDPGVSRRPPNGVVSTRR